MNRSAMTSWWPRSVILRLATLAFALWLAPTTRAAGTQERGAEPWGDHGLVVDEVQPSLVTDEESFRPGDVLLTWRRDGDERARGAMRTYIDWLVINYEELDRGPVFLMLERDGELVEIRLHVSRLSATFRPRLGADARETFDLGKQKIKGGSPEEGLRLWQELADRFAEEERSQLASWLFREMFVVHLDQGDREAAFAATEEAARHLEPQQRPYNKVLLAMRLYWEAKDHQLFLAWLHEALELQEQIVAESLTAARIRSFIAAKTPDLANARVQHLATLRLVEKLAPDSLLMAGTLGDLGVLALLEHEPRQARGHLLRSYELYRRHRTVGDAVLMNLGIASRQLGDLAAAEDFYFQALSVREELYGSRSGHVGLVLLNLGNLAYHRGDLRDAETYYRRALDLLGEDRDPIYGASVLHDLGDLARERGQLDEAEDLLQEALRIRESQEFKEPEGLRTASTHRALGQVALERGDLDAAARRLTRARHITEKVKPHSLHLADTLDVLAELQLSRGQVGAAEKTFQRSLDLRRKLPPDSGYEARAYRGLGRLEQRRGDEEKALEFYARALDALDLRQYRLGGTDRTRSGFTSRYLDYYDETIALLVARDRAVEAFQVLERSRARSFLAQLAERDLLVNHVPEDFQKEQHRLRRESDEILGKIEELGAESDDEVRNELLERWREVEQSQDRLRARIRSVSPRLAALRYPQPLDLAAARAQLDPGTLVLAYTVGRSGSFLFLIGPGAGDYDVLPLDVREDSLRDDVERLRTFIAQGHSSRATSSVERLTAAMSAQLLAPAAGVLARAERLLILPDGPLHYLPFAALHDPTRTERRYLIESSPLHVAASLTAMAEIRARRRPARKVTVAAFGDPLYSGAESEPDTASPLLRSLERGGLELPALPSTRSEVEGLGEIFAERARIFTGARATEEQAKQVGSEASILHFACHAVLDERSPLGSALALTLPSPWRPGQENGLLQAWEILEQVRLDADLVTLSACETGLGRERGGEGLLGLSRAFQFAGARSVLASLWSVSDRSTAVLMRLFYTHLEAGLAKDEALRQAQMALLSGQASTVTGLDTRHPFYWAAFQLIGDWR